MAEYFGPHYGSSLVYDDQHMASPLQGQASLFVTSGEVQYLDSYADADSIRWCRIPARALIHAFKLRWTAMAGTSDMDVGLWYNDNAGGGAVIVNDCFTVADIATANTGTDILSADAGKSAFAIAGLAADPGGTLDVVGQVETAGINTTGTMSFSIFYSIV